MPKVTTPPTPTEALREWAQANGMNAAKFSRASGFSYMYAWMLLNGDKAITSETFGRLVLAFGSEAMRGVEAALKAERAAVA
jgi:plasmid maintenance system antidote protein VapI